MNPLIFYDLFYYNLFFLLGHGSSFYFTNKKACWIMHLYIQAGREKYIQIENQTNRFTPDIFTIDNRK